MHAGMAGICSVVAYSWAQYSTVVLVKVLVLVQVLVCAGNSKLAAVCAVCAVHFHAGLTGLWDYCEGVLILLV